MNINNIVNTFRLINISSYYSKKEMLPKQGAILLAVNFTNIIFYIKNNFFDVDDKVKKRYLFYLDGWYSKFIIGKNVDYYTGFNILFDVIELSKKNNTIIHFIVPRKSDINKLYNLLPKSLNYKISVWEFNNKPLENDIIEYFRSSTVSIREGELIIFGIGSGIQEHVAKTWKFNNSILCIGAALDFFIGNQKRAPYIIRKYKLEWAYRFISNPKRMSKRVFVDPFLVFIYYIIYKYASR